MSRENVEVVMRWFELFDRGDWDALLRYVDSDIETTGPPEIPGGASYCGYSGLAMTYDHWAGQWDDFRVELKELIDAGSDVVAVTRHHGTGRASGAAVEGPRRVRVHGGERQARPHAPRGELCAMPPKGISGY